jgi:tetratricopeptide (TPR) repeat protein
VADGVTCAACGSAVPGGRTVCGRCGSRNLEAQAAPAETRSAKPMRFALVAVALTIVGIAIAMLAGSPNTTSPVAASEPGSVATGQSGAATDASSRQEAARGEFSALDASRSGVAAYNAGDIGAATTQFSAAVEADPNNASALNNFGQMLVRNGRSREAIPYFDRAIAIADGVWSYHFNRARAYAELKEWRRAIDGYTTAAKLFPDDYVTQFNLAKARQADGDLVGAINAYRRAAELAPDQAEFQLWYGLALERGGRGTEAAAAYRRFLELEPNGPQAEKVKARLAQVGGGTPVTP